MNKVFFVDVWKGFANLLERRTHLVLVALLLSSLLGSYFSFLLYKNLRTDIEELLPESAPSVQDLKRASNRFSGMNHLEVVIESQDSKAAERFQIDIAMRLRALPPEVVANVKESIREERAFFDKYRAYYVDLADWESVLETAKTKLRKASKKMFDLGISDEEEEASKNLGLPIRKLRAKYDNKTGSFDRFPNDYFQSDKGRTRVVLAFLPGKVTNVHGNELLSEETLKIVRELKPETYASDMRVGLGGDVQNVVEEHRELVKDLVLSFVVVTVLVTLVLWLYFGTLSAVTALSFTLFVGTALTFGVSYFLVGYLNANTAFLGSIVIGNGINFPIILLARYVELRRQRQDYTVVLREAMAYTWKPTLAAALAAGVAYGSLALTDFRGFSQFGVIGATGMALCWLATYVALPAFVLLLEGWGLMRISTRARVEWSPMTYFAPLAVRFHTPLAIGTIVLSLVAFAGAMRLSRHTIESDLSKLRNKWSMEHGSGYWGKRTDQVFGRGLTPTIVLTQGAEETGRLLTELKVIQAREKEKSPFASISVIEDFYPAHQPSKLAIMQELHKLLTPKVLETLRPNEAALVKDFLPNPPPPPFAMRDLPTAVLKGFQETDGRLQTVVQVYPRLSTDAPPGEARGTWNGEEVIRYTRLLREAIHKSGVAAVILGQNPISADMLEAVERDGPKATLFAFVAVTLLVLILFPSLKQATPVVLSLLLGVLWMIGAIGWFDWKINFLNFIALPITFGIGVDYAVNIFGRLFSDLRERGDVDLVQVLRETGGAVVLCSCTTVIGYGSLLLSGSQAFVSFGKLAVAGELTCIAAAMLSMPSLWLLSQRAKRKAQAEKKNDRLAPPEMRI